MSFKTLSLNKNKAQRQIWNSGEKQVETNLNKLFYHFQIGNSSNFKFLIIFWLLKIPDGDTALNELASLKARDWELS